MAGEPTIHIPSHVQGLLQSYLENPSEQGRGVLADSLEEIGHPAAQHLRSLPHVAHLLGQWGKRQSGLLSGPPESYGRHNWQGMENGFKANSDKYRHEFFREVVENPHLYNFESQPQKLHRSLHSRVRSALRRLAAKFVGPPAPAQVSSDPDIASIGQWGPKFAQHPIEAKHLNLAIKKGLHNKLQPVDPQLHLASAGAAVRDWYPEKQHLHQMLTAGRKDPDDFTRHISMASAFSPKGPLEGAEIATLASERLWHHGAVVNGKVLPPRSRNEQQVTEALHHFFRVGDVRHSDTHPDESLRGKPMIKREQKPGDREPERYFVTGAGDFKIGRDITGPMIRTVAKILTHPHQFKDLRQFHTEALAGKPEKINNFYHAMAGDQNRYVVDTHEAQLLGLKEGKIPITGPRYHIGSTMGRYQASLMNTERSPLHDHVRYGQGWTPSGHQASKWVGKRLIEVLAQKHPELHSSPLEIAKLVTPKRVWRAGSPTNTLLRNKAWRSLIRAGINEGLYPPTIFKDLARSRDFHRPEMGAEFFEGYPHPEELLPFVRAAITKLRRKAHQQTDTNRSTKPPFHERAAQAGPAWWEQPQ
jgi:hypothetical protein